MNKHRARLSCGAEGLAHYFGDRQRGLAILIAACLDSPARLSLTFGTARRIMRFFSGCALRSLRIPVAQSWVLEIWASHKESSPYIARPGTRL